MSSHKINSNSGTSTPPRGRHSGSTPNITVRPLSVSPPPIRRADGGRGKGSDAQGGEGDQDGDVTVKVVEVSVTSKVAVYHIQVETTHPYYARPKFTCTRLSVEIDRLYAYLTNTYPQYIPHIPPPSSLLWMEYDDYKWAVDEREKIRTRMTEFLQGCLDVGCMRADDTVRLFLESDFEFVSPNTNTNKKPTTSSSSSRSLRPFGGGAVKEVDVFFDNAKAAVSGMEAALAAVARTVERTGRNGKDLSKASGEIGTQLTAAASSNEDRALARAFKCVGKAFLVHERLQSDHIRSAHDSFIAFPQQATLLLHPQTDEWKRLTQQTSQAQQALQHRLDILQDYENACKATQKKLVAMDRLRGASKIAQEKVDVSLKDLTVTKQVEQEIRTQLRSTTDTLKARFPAYAQQQDREIAMRVDEHVAHQKRAAKKVLDLWKGALADLGGSAGTPLGGSSGNLGSPLVK
ncbi:uncharacterized protein EV422DRAFT_502907 [Fimicolochytrium jonesii]|uniref:uncharacterized protein n=1 Tax=Fimicolochytrium jonesii TaxID=1396493 RepID=UPI0022FEB14B|nr:uncharacterized protein EV422DRAFT_502907 [Fimicolochytrium jonesii]KAI8827219.1 hypothetical protein EV422DRAFT_502907 [Fimicolochytrium jonesii]